MAYIDFFFLFFLFSYFVLMCVNHHYHIGHICKHLFDHILMTNHFLLKCVNQHFQKVPFKDFGKFIHQFQPEPKTIIRKLERILIKLYGQNVSLLFNETYIYLCCVCYTKTECKHCNVLKFFNPLRKW